MLAAEARAHRNAGKSRQTVAENQEKAPNNGRMTHAVADRALRAIGEVGEAWGAGFHRFSAMITTPAITRPAPRAPATVTRSRRISAPPSMTKTNVIPISG